MIQFKLELDKIHLHSTSTRNRVVGKRAINYTTTEYKEFKKHIANEIKKQIDKDIDLSANYFLDLKLYYKVPKSYSKSKREELEGTYKNSSPDLDNCLKSLLDSFTGIIYEDDKQVVHINASKQYGFLSQEQNIIIDITMIEI